MSFSGIIELGKFQRQRRRIRSKSIILSSYRRQSRDWDLWLQWEMGKAFVPIILVTLLHMAGWIVIPAGLFLVMLAAVAAWMVFLSWNAWGAFRRMDKKRLQLLEDAGVQCDLSILRDPWAWKASLQGKTIHEVLHDPEFKGLG